MKQKKLLLTAALGAAVLAAASLQPMAQDQIPKELEITIVPDSSEAARIPPALLTELQDAGEPFGD